MVKLCLDNKRRFVLLNRRMFIYHCDIRTTSANQIRLLRGKTGSKYEGIRSGGVAEKRE